SVVGKLPTTTQPLRSTTNAVVSPTPPGQEPGRVFGSICAKRLKDPLGEICTRVVPVPCRFALLLKLLTRMFPRVSFPTVRSIRNTPYGLTSPLLGTVEDIVVIVPGCGGILRCAWSAVVMIARQHASIVIVRNAASNPAFRLFIHSS